MVKIISELIIDDREPDKVINEVLLSPLMAGIKMTVRPMEAGDFVFRRKGMSVGIESKTWSDLLTSIVGGRLQRQLIKLQSMYNYAVLLVKGQHSTVYQGDKTASYLDKYIVLPNGMVRKWQVKNLEGFFLTLQNRGVGIFQWPYDTGVDLALDFLIKHYKNVGEEDHSLEVGAQTPHATALAMLDTIPGIGPITARRLLSRYGNLQSLFHAKLEELEEATSKTLAKRLYEVLHGPI